MSKTNTADTIAWAIEQLKERRKIIGKAIKDEKEDNFFRISELEEEALEAKKSYRASLRRTIFWGILNPFTLPQGISETGEAKKKYIWAKEYLEGFKRGTNTREALLKEDLRMLDEITDELNNLKDKKEK